VSVSLEHPETFEALVKIPELNSHIVRSSEQVGKCRVDCNRSDIIRVCLITTTMLDRISLIADSIDYTS
jgi:hypothetical protein